MAKIEWGDGDDVIDLGNVGKTEWGKQPTPLGVSPIFVTSGWPREFTISGTFVCQHTQTSIEIESGVGIVIRCTWCGELIAVL